MGMKAPDYRWTCHKCGCANEPGISSCAKCDFPAVSDAVDIARARGEPPPLSEGYRALAKGGWWTLLPLLWPW
jgi:hypothetical protein